MHSLKNLIGESIDGDSILIVRMAHSIVPVAFHGRFYQRVGNTTREVPTAELTGFLLERSGQTWEGQPADADVGGLSHPTIQNFAAAAQTRLAAIRGNDNPEIILRNLHLITPAGRVTRAAQLLFGQDVQRTIPSAEVQIGRFTDATTILDDRR